MTDRRKESRKQFEAKVCVWGRDADGLPFRKEVVASNVSHTGALLTGLDVRLRCDDMLLVRYKETQARFRVIWVRDGRAAVQRRSDEPCPWPELLSRTKSASASSKS